MFLVKTHQSFTSIEIACFFSGKKQIRYSAILIAGFKKSAIFLTLNITN
jgi:hypothetical protein